MRALLVAVVVLAGSVTASAQDAVATASVNVRSGQSMSSRILDHLDAGDTVQLLSPTRRRGYYHIAESSGTRGWVYSRYLRVVEVTTPAVAVVPTASTSAVASVIDSGWDKPAGQNAVFHRNGAPDCGASGAGGDTLTDLLKNRTDEPTLYHPVTFDAIVALPYPRNHQPHRTSWSDADLAVIRAYEGVAISVTGFIAAHNGIIVQNKQHSSHGEATNCHATDDEGVDWHITLVKSPSDPKSAGIVVETTPRVRANGHPWTPAMLLPSVAAGDSVRFFGWLMFDPEHFAQTSNYDPAHPSNGLKVRASLWEIHPVTRIDVFDSATRQWRTLP